MATVGQSVEGRKEAWPVRDWLHPTIRQSKATAIGVILPLSPSAACSCPPPLAVWIGRCSEDKGVVRTQPDRLMSSSLAEQLAHDGSRAAAVAPLIPSSHGHTARSSERAYTYLRAQRLLYTTDRFSLIGVPLSFFISPRFHCALLSSQIKKYNEMKS
jgi:hypothetical protein